MAPSFGSPGGSPRLPVRRISEAAGSEIENLGDRVGASGTLVHQGQHFSRQLVRVLGLSMGKEVIPRVRPCHYEEDVCSRWGCDEP
jgi:hypothetical protein